MVTSKVAHFNTGIFPCILQDCSNSKENKVLVKVCAPTCPFLNTLKQLQKPLILDNMLLVFSPDLFKDLDILNRNILSK